MVLLQGLLHSLHFGVKVHFECLRIGIHTFLNIFEIWHLREYEIYIYGSYFGLLRTNYHSNEHQAHYYQSFHLTLLFVSGNITTKFLRGKVIDPYSL